MKEGERARERFKPPKAEEVREYAGKMGYTFDPESFVAYYEARGWKLNGKPMVSWKAACVTWAKREPGNGHANPSSSSYPQATPETVALFNRTMIGKNAEDYAEAYRLRFGQEPRA